MKAPRKPGRKVRAHKTAEGSYDAHGVFTSYDGDDVKLAEGGRDYLEQHFAADDFEADRPAWPPLKTTREERREIGPTEEELRVVWRACSEQKAFGVDGIPKEATTASDACLDDLLRLVGASIFQEDVRLSCDDDGDFRPYIQRKRGRE